MENFIDSARLLVEAGDGGDGCKAMRREKFIANGGPDGGDGGRGGNVVLIGASGLRALAELSRMPVARAEKGANGGRKKQDGRSGEDKILRCPLGTTVSDLNTGELIGEVLENGQTLVVATGGRGGRGNTHFTTSVRQAPKLAENGEAGVSRELKLELKLLADAGLVGKPNAGKSTLLSRLSRANAKTGAYAFTTLHPQLGVVQAGDSQFVLADLPGLIEGAAQGKGLGHNFLKHVERTRLLIYLLDAAGVDGSDAFKDWEDLRRELSTYDERLDLLPRVVVLNKMDLVEAREAFPELKQKFENVGCRVIAASGASGEGSTEIIETVVRTLENALPLPGRQASGQKKRIYRPAARFELEKKNDTWVLSGAEIMKWMVMTDFENEEAVAKLKHILKRMGISRALKEAGAQEGDTVRVGKEEFGYVPD